MESVRSRRFPAAREKCSADMSPVLNEVLNGSLQGKADGHDHVPFAAPSSRWRDIRTVLADIAKLLNAPAPQPFKAFHKLLDRSPVRQECPIVEEGVEVPAEKEAN